MNLKEIGEKRQKKRKETDLYKVKEDMSKPKFYVLDMFPYPSGAGLHVGHPKGYIASDTLARKKMLQGFNVLHPMGFDTFGLGTENYAIEHKMKPQDVAKQNIENYIKQLEMFGTTYDRSRSVNTADPKYFKWTQRVFLQFYNHYYDEQEKKAKPIVELKLKIENGKLKINEDIEKYLNKQRLAYVDYKPINRCPKCMTGLANEDLDDGKCERCGSEVEQKPMKQRVLRITKYAERLLEGLDTLHREESMKDLERNWIGKSEGTQFQMNIATGGYTSKVLILHGLNGDTTNNRFPRLKDKLESQNIETIVPILPNVDNPNLEEQIQFLQDNYGAIIDEDTTIVGHSLGCFLAKQFMVRYNKKIKTLIDVAPIHDGLKIDNDRINNYINGVETNSKKLEKLLDNHIVFLSTDDEIIPYHAARSYYENMLKGAKIISLENRGHFNKKRGNVGELPELLPYILSSSGGLSFEVYTTRIDTVFGMSFVAIAPEHPLVEKITTKEFVKDVEKYKDAAKKKTQLERTELQKEKTGVFCGAYAINPFNGEKVPVFVADYVLANYGTGVVMAVPAHDERDFEFAKKYNLPIKHVIGPSEGEKTDKMARKSSGYAIFYDEKKDALLMGIQNKDGKNHYRFLGGTTEEGEDIISGTIREIAEESGFNDVQYIDDICCQQAFYFADIKNEWKENNAKYLLFKLNSDAKQPKQLMPHEKDYPIEWIPYDEVVKEMDGKDHHYNQSGRGFVLDMIKKYFNGNGAYTNKGALIDSGPFSGITSDEAINQMQARLEKKGIGGKKVNYKMQDRVFSRQRYRGEPFPVLRTEMEDMPKVSVNFYNNKARKAILDGVKTIETRALNPEEPDKYFGNVKVGDVIEFHNKETGASVTVKISKVYHWANFAALWKEDKKIIEQMFYNKADFQKVKTIEDLKAHRSFLDGYIERIEKNGLVGRTFDILDTPVKSSTTGSGKKVLIIHGFEGRKEGNWLPRVEQELEKIGYEVFNETLPNPDSPDYDESMEFLLPYFNKLGNDGLVVGHSLGGKFALKLVEQADQKIGKLILVAPVTKLKKDFTAAKKNPEFQDSDIVALGKMFDIKLNFKKIDKNAEQKILLLSSDDPYVSLDTQDVVSKQRDVKIFDNKGHFQDKEDQDILDAIIGSPSGDQKSVKIIPLNEKELPLLLPDVDNYEPTGTEEGPLANITDWVNVTLPDGTKAKRETNTMPGRAGSSRYWLRYMDPTNDKALVGKEQENYRKNVDVYIGGAEHVTRHMIYGRFWQKFLYDIGAISHDEPFQEYHYVGLIMGEDGRKMSKRRGNVVNPDDIISQFGADTLRTYEMFMGPFEQAIAWNTAGISGTKKFLDKVQNLLNKITPTPSLAKRGEADGKPPLLKEVLNEREAEDSIETQILLNQTIKKVGENIDEFKFNTAISQLMILTNHLTEVGTLSRTAFETLVILLSPFAPHLAEELWEQLGNEYSIFTKATRPKYDAKCLVADTITIAVQINGKVRGTICISQDADESEAMTAAKADEKINNRITSEPKKVIYVKGKILNIVV